jgi:hypothetical protein
MDVLELKKSWISRQKCRMNLRMWLRWPSHGFRRLHLVLERALKVGRAWIWQPWFDELSKRRPDEGSLLDLKTKLIPSSLNWSFRGTRIFVDQFALSLLLLLVLIIHYLQYRYEHFAYRNNQCTRYLLDTYRGTLPRNITMNNPLPVLLRICGTATTTIVGVWICTIVPGTCSPIQLCRYWYIDPTIRRSFWSLNRACLYWLCVACTEFGF